MYLAVNKPSSLKKQQLIKKNYNSYIEIPSTKVYWDGPHKILVIEELIGLFFVLNFHLDKDQLNLIFLK